MGQVQNLANAAQILSTVQQLVAQLQNILNQLLYNIKYGVCTALNLLEGAEAGITANLNVTVQGIAINVQGTIDATTSVICGLQAQIAALEEQGTAAALALIPQLQTQLDAAIQSALGIQTQILSQLTGLQTALSQLVTLGTLAGPAQAIVQQALNVVTALIATVQQLINQLTSGILTC